MIVCPSFVMSDRVALNPPGDSGVAQLLKMVPRPPISQFLHFDVFPVLSKIK